MPKDMNDLERPKGSVQKELSNVTKLLDDGKFTEALQLVQRCFYWFQECPLFAKNDTEKNRDSAKSNDDGKEERTEEKQSQDTLGDFERENDESEENSDGKVDDNSSRKQNRKSRTNKTTINWFTVAMKVYLRKPPKKAKKNQNLDEHDEMNSSHELTEQVRPTVHT